jgi:hypothetical protein
MSIFELTLEDTLARKNSNKIWFFTTSQIKIQTVQWYNGTLRALEKC